MRKFLRFLDLLLLPLARSMPAVDRLRRLTGGRPPRFRPKSEQLEFRWSSKF